MLQLFYSCVLLYFTHSKEKFVGPLVLTWTENGMQAIKISQIENTKLPRVGFEPTTLAVTAMSVPVLKTVWPHSHYEIFGKTPATL